MAGSQSASHFVLGTQTRNLEKYHQESLTPLLNKPPIGLSPQKKKKNLSLLFTRIQYSKRGGNKKKKNQRSHLISFHSGFKSGKYSTIRNRSAQDLTESGFELIVTYICSSPTSAHLKCFHCLPSEDYNQYLNFKGNDTEAPRGDKRPAEGPQQSTENEAQPPDLLPSTLTRSRGTRHMLPIVPIFSAGWIKTAACW